MRFIFQSLLFVLILTPIACQQQAPGHYFQIRVVDEDTGRGIPLVEMTSMDAVSYFTDSQGYIAFEDDGLMDKQVYFKIKSPGYYFPPDTLGHHGLTLMASAGDSVLIKMKRTNVAERLYRVTGSGIYRHSRLLGLPVPASKPLLNAGVLGQDSNLSTIYKGRIFWIWGDTFLPGQYIGNFSVSGATSELPAAGRLPVAMGVDLTYFTDEKGNSRKMIDPQGPGYVWFDWLMNIPDQNGKEQLVAKYARVNAYFGNYERGIAVYNDEKEIFERYREVEEWMDEVHTCHHPFKGTTNGRLHNYLTAEFNFCRVRPVLNDLVNPSTYECYSCLKPGETFDKTSPALDRDAEGKLQYGWKTMTDAVDHKRQQQLLDNGRIAPGEEWIQLLDIDSGDPVLLSRGSVFWNDYRQRWILIMGLKDVYFAEADTPVGPWVYTRKVAAHDNFFYNPLQHPFFDEEGGKQIYFEGTYTKWWGEGTVVPRYNYNQLLYRLNLEDERMDLPVCIYQLNDGELAMRQQLIAANKAKAVKEVPFLALPATTDEAPVIPLYNVSDNGSARLTRTKGETAPFCYVLPAETRQNDPFLGAWECQINYASFNNFFVCEISENGDAIDVRSDKGSFKLSNPFISNDTLSLTLEQEANVYLLKGIIKGGKMEGTFENQATGAQGKWTASKKGYTWWPAYSTAVVPLYEYRNKRTNTFTYSTDPSMSKTVFERSAQPLCRVWEYPYSQVIADFEIRSAE